MGKMTFRQRIENLWYHNKFNIIVISAFAIFIIIATVQLLTKKEPDANLLYMGPASITFSAENYLQETMATVMKEDYNGDGKKSIDYIELTAVKTNSSFDDTEGDFATGYTPTDMQKTVGESFAAQIIAGDSMIYLLDESYFNVAEETGVLMPLSEVLGYTPDNAYSSYALYLSDLDISYMPGFDRLPKSTLICIRYPVTLTNGKKEVENREKWNMSVFRDMVSHVYADKPIAPSLPELRNVSVNEFQEMLKIYATKKGLSITDDTIATANEVTPEGFFDEVGANLFKVGGATYLAWRDSLFPLGKHVGGDGVIDVAICDFDDDGVSDLIFTYTYQKGDITVSSASVFNFTTLKETFLQFESEYPLIIKKIGEQEFELHSANSSADLSNTLLENKTFIKHIYTLISQEKDIIIISKDV